MNGIHIMRPDRLLTTVSCLALLLSTACSREVSTNDVATEDRGDRSVVAYDDERFGGHSGDRRVVSPDGETVRIIKGRAFVIDDFGPVPEGTPAEAVRRLEADAFSGNASASYGIFLKINECLAVSKRAAEGLLPRADPDVVVGCGQLGADDAASAAKWLALAAEQGSLSARLHYASDPESVIGDSSEMLRDPDKAKEYKEKAMGYLVSAADHGSIDALLRLANAYDAGVLVGRDPVASLGYFNAVGMLDPGLVPSGQVEALRRSMSAEQSDDAQRQAEVIHGRCCR